MAKNYVPPPYVEAELAADLRVGFPMTFAADNIVDGDRFTVTYTQFNWMLSAVVLLRWQHKGEELLEQFVPYSYRIDASSPGGYRWVCEQE